MLTRIDQVVGRVLRPWKLAPLAAAACFASVAQAQTPAAATDDSGLEEVVVTAQFREQRLQDTPIAITAVNAALLESRNQTSLAAVAAQAPNVVLRETGGAFGPGMSATRKARSSAQVVLGEHRVIRWYR